MILAGLCSLLTTLWCCECGVSSARAPLAFPPALRWGAATAAYQVEGGWDAADKSPSIWDTFTHARADVVSGDVACDSYHLWRQDVRLAKRLGLQFYRFSISWSRLIPNSETFEISHDGWQYYDNLINALLQEGIEPMVTLYHWDLPQSLQDYGGWLNSSISDYFARYALTAYILFADRVKSWLTLNEPVSFCNIGYGLGLVAPGVAAPQGEYLCAKNAMLAHAKAWRLYDTEFRVKYGGRVSIANHALWYEGELANLAQQHTLGLYAHPIFSKEGGWPVELMEALTSNDTGPLLPQFSEEERLMVQGTFDFFALNFYTSRVVRGWRAGDAAVLLDSPYTGNRRLRLVYDTRPHWNTTNVFWFVLNPPGLRKQLSWIKEHYDNPEIFITENGFPSERGLEDEDRIDAIHSHLVQAWLAVNEDAVRLTGYTYWSMMDNLEWHMGYDKRFGLAEVDFNSSLRPRTVRRSGEYYRDHIRAQNSSSSYKPTCIYLLLLIALLISYYY